MLSAPIAISALAKEVRSVLLHKVTSPYYAARNAEAYRRHVAFYKYQGWHAMADAAEKKADAWSMYELKLEKTNNKVA